MTLIPKYYFLAISLVILFAFSSFSQDTTKPKPILETKKDTSYVQNFILADHRHLYLNHVNPDTITRRRFSWYPTKTLEDIFNNVPGFYLYYMDVGQYNPLIFDQLGPTNTGFLRNGRLLNDPIDGQVDLNLLSRNEIAEIELTNGYGNSLYNVLNNVNIVQRQLFQFRPYTEISFYQDRYENLYFDGNFHQNFSKKFNFNFGITKHSYDGNYVNSAFDKWLGRFNLTFAGSSKLNFFASVNYAKIERKLNRGIEADSIDLGNKKTVFDPLLATVIDSRTYEKRERFDIDIGAVLLSGKSSFTRLQFFVSNSYRSLNTRDTNNALYTNNFRWINYGGKLLQNLDLKVSKELIVKSRSEAEFDYFLTHWDLFQITDTFIRNYTRAYAIENIDVLFKKFRIGGYLKADFENDFNDIYLNGGISGDINLVLDSMNSFGIKAHTNSLFNFTGIDLRFTSGISEIKTGIFAYKPSKNSNAYYSGINTALNLRLYKFDFNILYTRNIKRDEEVKNMPVNFGNVSVAWHDVAFKNKLEYKIGISSRFWSSYRASSYDSYNKNFTYGYYQYIDSTIHYTYFNRFIPANATLDFYIMGKIGKATFGLTFENILDRVIYNTGVYPYMDRGGLFNSLSRFNITWNFFD